MYTDWNESVCLFIFLVSDSLPRWFIFVDMYMNICTYIIHNKVYMNKIYIYKFYMYKVYMSQITVPMYRNKSPQKMSVAPAPAWQVIIISIWLEFYEDDRWLPWVLSSIHIQRWEDRRSLCQTCMSRARNCPAREQWESRLEHELLNLLDAEKSTFRDDLSLM